MLHPIKLLTRKILTLKITSAIMYSIAQLGVSKRTRRFKGKGMYTITSLFTYVDIKIYDSEEIFKKLNKLSPKKRAKNKYEIINYNSSNIARFYIYPKDDFISTSLLEEMNTIRNSLYKDDVFLIINQDFYKTIFKR